MRIFTFMRPLYKIDRNCSHLYFKNPVKYQVKIDTRDIFVLY
ncbi:hypothetical protein D1AOALGA4SA_3599 [Olavius algarvensis Delta 1 endosymbiont]|nr:hypothetical protein D1AOALGA4SA_3599 [Olavius algarvensis Delta 1 endosymbiont]